MKAIKKNVYYCDFCKKKGLSASAISVHEKHCTANPNRECRLCVGLQNDIAELAGKFKARFKLNPNEDNTRTDFLFHVGYEYIVEWIGEPVTLKEIREEVGNCPNCILAVLRQTGLNKHYFEFEKFDYQKELSEAMAEKNRDAYEESFEYH